MTETPWGGRVFYRPTTASTMDDARELEARGEPDGSVAWAGFQTAGRGRHPGRLWHGVPGHSLLFTVYWSPSRFRVPSFAPSLTVGLGVCLWLESLGVSSRLKWPNDVYLGDRKVAGILVRQSWGPTGPGVVHAGIGINLRPPEADEFRTAPGSLAEAGLVLDPGHALETLLPWLAKALDEGDPKAACQSRLWRLGEEIELTLPREGWVTGGTVLGLENDGRLVLEGPQGRESLSSGE